MRLPTLKRLTLIANVSSVLFALSEIAWIIAVNTVVHRSSHLAGDWMLANFVVMGVASVPRLYAERQQNRRRRARYRGGGS